MCVEAFILRTDCRQLLALCRQLCLTVRELLACLVELSLNVLQELVQSLRPFGGIPSSRRAELHTTSFCVDHVSLQHSRHHSLTRYLILCAQRVLARACLRAR